MSWIETIRNKPREQKVRFIWIIVICSLVILIALWVLTSRIHRSTSKDSTLFKTISRGFKDLKNNYHTSSNPK